MEKNVKAVNLVVYFSIVYHGRRYTLKFRYALIWRLWLTGCSFVQGFEENKTGKLITGKSWEEDAMNFLKGA